MRVHFKILTAVLIPALVVPIPGPALAGERDLIVGGSPLQVRGVSYQPTPIGENPAQSPPYGDYYTDGYAALHDRDLPRLRDLGANVIRVYGWSTTEDHRDFLDKCWNGGVRPIRVLVNRWVNPQTNWSSAAAVDAISAEFVAIDARLGSHPAVLGIIIGNEANVHSGNGANPAFWAAMNSVAGAIKAQTPGRRVSVAITDAIAQIAAHDAAMANLDFWCVQVYRGATFGSFFQQYAVASTRPLIITEFGLDAYDAVAGGPYPDGGATVAGIVSALWSELVANNGVAAGGCVFEYCDEWWKGGGAATHDAGGFAMGGFPDGFANEEWWGLYAVNPAGSGLPDTLSPRAAVAALRAWWNPPPVISTQPLASVVAAGAVAIFTVGVETGCPFDIRWRHNGIEIPGAHATTLVVPSAQTFLAGSYDAVVTGSGGSVTSGVATLTVTPAADSESRLLNISTRGHVGSGGAVLIPGFVISSEGPKTLLLRVIGPGLASFGVSGVLEDPVLTLHQTRGQPPEDVTVLSCDDWGEYGDAADIASASELVGAFALAPGSADASLIATLAPGAYTLHAAGAAGGAGVALAEVYLIR